LFEPILKIMHQEKTPSPFHKRLLAGIISGLIGAVASTPFDLLKTRLQSQALGSNALVGHQHGYTGLRSGLSHIISEHGIRGLWVGTGAATVRQAIGSTAQLTSYSMTKDEFLSRNYSDSPKTHLMCSLISSFFTVLFMNPVDVIRTRVYNQVYGVDGRGVSYKGVVDAFLKILRGEGVRGLYKGVSASFLRLAPHLSVTFLVLEQFKRWRPLG